MSDRHAEAVEVLEANRREGYTIPSATLYPFQWNWDSAFVALGLASVDPAAAARELTTLLSATWPDGLLPQIVFWEDAEGYFPGPEEWDVDVERAPVGEGGPVPAGERVRTSAITQPPMVVPAARRVYEATEDESFREAVLPPLARHLDWWLDARGADDLVAVRHPWETGMDDSPAWTDPLAAFDPGDVSYDRADRKNPDLADQRPDDWDYDRYVALVRQGRDLDWDETRLREASPFRVEDALTNALFVRACEDLAALAGNSGGADGDPDASAVDPDRWRAQADASRGAMRDRLWDGDLGTFVSRDRVGERPLRANSVAGLVATYAGVPTDAQFARLRENVEGNFLAYEYALPSYVGEGMNPDRYWRGPVWMNTNWLVAEGLRRYGATDLADRVVADGVELVEREGFREYFNPESGEGRGSDRFSWSAALYLDWRDRRS